MPEQDDAVTATTATTATTEVTARVSPAGAREAVVGDELAELVVPVTRTLIVAGALASRDYQDVHHDAELARAKGSPDIFMNILTTNGLVGRFVTDHFGPGSALRRVAVRLGAPNYPGDTMVLSGTVTAVGEDTVEVEVVGRNGIGRHVTGSVTVSLHSEAAPDPSGCSEPESGNSFSAPGSPSATDGGSS